MKALINKVADAIFAFSDKRVAKQVLLVTLDDLTSFKSAVCLTKAALCQAIANQTQTQLNASQLAYLLKLLPNYLKRYGYQITIRLDEVFVNKIKSKRDFAL